MRQTSNSVKIEGILSEIDLNYGSFVKNGATVESIGGQIKIKVVQPINGVDTVLEVPVHMFASKLTNKGTPNPAYESIEKVKNSYVSIAAGGEEAAECVRITNGNIQMNEYYTPDGRFIRFPRITASFVQRVKKEEYKSEATFSVELIVMNKNMEVTADGVETGRCLVEGVLVQYGNKCDLVPFIGMNKGVINAIDNYWNKYDTVKANGRLNFSSTTETVIEKVDFGEPVEKVHTITVSELIITGGSQTPMDGEFAFSREEVDEGLAKRVERLAAQKEKDMSRGATKKAPAPANTTSNGKEDLGF